MAARLIGAHMPTSGGLGNSVRRGKEIGCTAIQVFTSSPQQWKSKPITPEMVADLQAAREETGLTEIVSHDSYLINLCAATEEQREKSANGLANELVRCSQLGIRYVVSHMGAHCGQGEEVGLKAVSAMTTSILADAPKDVTLLMETTAGQGTCLNCTFEQLATCLDQCGGHPQLAICLDTCHIFVAGYDIRDEEAFLRTFDEFDRIIGLDRLKVIHCNDSKKPLASRVDRHEHIGEGFIGKKAFELLVNDPRFEKVPILLETPVEDEGHERDLAKLKSLMRT